MDLAVLSHVSNMYTLPAKEANVCRDLTNTITIDDSLNSTPFSLSQIRKFMGKFIRLFKSIDKINLLSVRIVISFQILLSEIIPLLFQVNLIRRDLQFFWTICLP